jgi:hypothetical protein
MFQHFTELSLPTLLQLGPWEVKGVNHKVRKFGVGRGVERERRWGDATKVQYKLIWNCHYESPCMMNIF